MNSFEFIWIALLVVIIFILMFGIWIPIFRKNNEGFGTAQSAASTAGRTALANEVCARTTFGAASTAPHTAQSAVERLRMAREYIENREKKY